MNDSKATNGFTSGPLTLEKMMQALSRLPVSPRPSHEFFSPRQFPLEFGGMRVIERQPFPKLRLRDDVEMSDEFRQDINAWLIEMFGYEDHVMKPHEFIISTDFNFIVARPEGVALIKHLIT